MDRIKQEQKLKKEEQEFKQYLFEKKMKENEKISQILLELERMKYQLELNKIEWQNIKNQKT